MDMTSSGRFIRVKRVDQERIGADPAAANLKITHELSRTDHGSDYFWPVDQSKQG
jgi:hypothetical protein